MDTAPLRAASITVVMVSYRSRHSIDPTLAALERCRKRDLIEAVLVDNDSQDGCVEYVQSKHPWIDAFDSKANLGFGRGCNLGFDRVKTPYVLFLNPDATIEPDALEVLIRFMEQHPQTGACGPAISGHHQDAVQYAGMMTDPAQVMRSALGIANAFPQRRPILEQEAPFRTTWLSGSILLIPSTVFREMGGFDSRFFLYFEETDLLRRMAKAGYEIWAVGEAVAGHEGSVSTKQSNRAMIDGCIAEHFYRSRFYYLVKHFGWPLAGLAEGLDIALAGLRNQVKRILGQPLREDCKVRWNSPWFQFPDPE